jgi:DNA-binding transcriptional MerR regulator
MTEPTMQIGEVAERIGLSLRTIRYYEEVGLITPSARSQGGFRLYTEHDAVRLQVVKDMKPLGFSLDEMRDLLGVLDRLDGVDEAARRRWSARRCWSGWRCSAWLPTRAPTRCARNCASRSRSPASCAAASSATARSRPRTAGLAVTCTDMARRLSLSARRYCGPASCPGRPGVRRSAFMPRLVQVPPALGELLARLALQAPEQRPVAVVVVLDDLERPAVGDHVAAHQLGGDAVGQRGVAGRAAPRRPRRGAGRRCR